jgi:hypothetical protein
MQKYLYVIAGLVLVATSAMAQPAPTEPCEQIRTQIRGQTGILPKPDTDLLQKLSARSDCRFTAQEVYRAAYGDKPMPKNDPSPPYSSHNHHDDD